MLSDFTTICGTQANYIYKKKHKFVTVLIKGEILFSAAD